LRLETRLLWLAAWRGGCAAALSAVLPNARIAAPGAFRHRLALYRSSCRATLILPRLSSLEAISLSRIFAAGGDAYAVFGQDAWKSAAQTYTVSL